MGSRRWWFALALLLFPAWARAQPYVFASNAADESVAVVDLASDTVAATLPLSGRPTGAALSRDGRRLFVARTQLDSLAMIDTATGVLVSVAVGSAPSAVAVAPGRRRAYVANTGDDTISVIDTATGAVPATVAVGAEPVKVVAGSSRVYVANWGGHSVSVLDTLSNRVLATVPVGTFPAGLLLHRGRLYVANFGDDTVSVIDSTHSVVATIAVGRRPRGLALDPVARRLYVASFEDGSIDVIDTATNTVTLSAPSGGSNPTDLMVDPGGQRLYVAHLEAGQPLRVLDAATLAPLGAIDAPAGPVSLAGFGQQAPPANEGGGRLGALFDAMLSPRRAPGRAPVTQRVEAAGKPVVISDGEFNVAQWLVFGNGTSTTTRETAGGNPGAWRNSVHTAGPQPVETWHVFQGASYDPAVLDAIDAVDVSWDRKVAGETPMTERFVVMQNAFVYRTAVQGLFTHQSWMSAGLSQLTAADFSDDNGNHPDFSASGRPLFFGYYRRTPQGGTGGHGTDNFRVVIYPTAGPGALAFQKSVDLIDTDTAIVTLERLGGTQGAVGATVRVVHPDETITTQPVSWANGDDQATQVGVTLLLRPGGGVQTARLSLIDATGGAAIAPGRGEMALMHAPASWPPEMLAMYLSFQVLLAAVSPEWLLALAVPALLLARRRSARRAARARLVRVVAAAALIAANAACVPSGEIVYSNVGFNRKLRPDRKPLDVPAQTTSVPDAQKFGPYRVAAGELASPIVPGVENAGRIRQSACWWMAGGDAVRARWEAIVELGGDASEHWEDPEDQRLELGACRMNDPETRNPPQSREGQDPSVDLDCSRLGDRTTWTLSEDAALPRCTADAVLLNTRLDAFGATLNDPYLRCDVVWPTFTRYDRAIYQGIDNFDGASAGAGDQARVSNCAAADGNQLIPPMATRYRLWLSDSVTQWLDPVVMPVMANTPLGRRMDRVDANWSWSTLVTADPGGSGSTRWEENFSPSLRVRSVAVFEPAEGGGKRYVDASPAPTATNPPPKLCIEDPDFLPSGCRWTCDDPDPGDGRLSYDLLAPEKCHNSSNVAEIPSVNPTAVPLNLGDRTQTVPLRWRLDAGRLPQADLWLEFTLLSTRPPAGLTAAPPVIDLGSARVGESERAAFVVRNHGEHPIRITSVAMAPPGPGSPHSGDFQPQLPFAPQPVPLPVEVVSSTTKETTLRTRPDAEREVLHRFYRDHVLARLAPRGQGFSETIDGYVVREQDRLLTRDVLNARFNHDVRRQPAVRMTYALRTPPFIVQPGESFEVSVRGTPSARRERQAEVRVSGQSVLDPTRTVEIRVLAKLYGLQGPLLSVMPGALNLYVDQGAGHERVRTLLVQNAGDVAGLLGRPSLSGPGGTGLPADSPFSLEDPYASWGSLGVGEYREVRLRFVSACGATPGDRDDYAQVRWSTADGPIVVPVHGQTYCP